MTRPRRYATRLLTIAVVAIVAAACDESPTGPSVGFGASVTLAPGEVVQLAGTSTSVTFVGVMGDSRCPADAICIQGGDAIVRLTIDDGGAPRAIELHTGSMRPVESGGLTFHLEDLQPYPFSSRTIAPHEYRATLRVTR
jgi:hypothetical protein